MEFISSYHNEPPTMDREFQEACRLWRDYHRDTERFDRSICTGEIGRDGGVMPANSTEAIAINRNAASLLESLHKEALRLGIREKTLKDARISVQNRRHLVGTFNYSSSRVDLDSWTRGV